METRQDNAQQLAKLAQLFNADKLLTTQDVETILQSLIKVLANNKSSVEQMSTETKQQANDLFEKIADEHYKLQQKVDETMGMSKAEMDSKMEKMMSDCKALMDECKMAMPQNGMDGKDADEEKIVKDVLAQIKLPEYKETVLDNAEQIAEKLQTLEKAWLEVSKIKGLSELLNQAGSDWLSQAKGFVPRSLDSLYDVAVRGRIADGQSLIWNALQQKWIPGTGAGSGSLAVEIPVGSINDVNTTFTVSNTPVFVTLQGQVLAGSGVDYTYSGGTITMNDAPITGNILRSYHN